LGDFPSQLGVLPPATFLDWALVVDLCERIEDIEEDHPQKVRGVCLKSRGRRKLLNLECSINYDAYGTSSRALERQGLCCLVWSALCGFGFEGWVFLLFCLGFSFARFS
jgi:hypothetical protein